MIIILGSSGVIGTHIIEKLKQNNINYCAPSRKELNEPEKFDPILNQHTIIINAIGIAPGYGDAKHQAVYLAQKKFLDHCIKLGVQKIISLSALSQYDSPDDIPYLKYRRQLDQYLLNSTNSTYIVRPSLVYSDKGVSTQFFKKLSKLPILAFPNKDGYCVSPIHIDDLVDFIVVLLNTNLPSQVFEVGTEKITLGNYLKLFNPKLIILPLPEWMMTLSMNMLGIVLPSIAGKYAYKLLKAGSFNQRDDFEKIMQRKAREVL